MNLWNRVKNLFTAHQTIEHYHATQIEPKAVSNGPVQQWYAKLPSQYQHTDFKDLPAQLRYEYVVSMAELYEQALPDAMGRVGKMLNMIVMTMFERNLPQVGFSMLLQDNATQQNTVAESFHLSVQALMEEKPEFKAKDTLIQPEKKTGLVKAQQEAVMDLYSQCSKVLQLDEKAVATLCAQVLVIFELASEKNYDVLDATLKKPYNGQMASKYDYYARLTRDVQKN